MEQNKIQYNRFCTINKKGDYINIKQMEIVKDILKCYNIIFVDGEYCYLYKNGVYVSDFQGTQLKHIIQKYIPDSILTARKINEVFNLIKLREEIYITEKQLNNYPKTVINFKNCMLEVKTLQTFKHDPKYYSTIQVQHDYNPKANYPSTFLNFVDKNTNTQNNAKWLLLQYIAYSMTRSLAFKTALMIKGKRDSGKSVLLKLIQFIVGEDYCSNIMLQDIADRFNTIGIKDKMLNVFADIDSKPLEASGIFKMIIGGDTLKGERKGMDIIHFKPFCKQIYSCNDIPKMLGDKSDATISKFSFIAWEYVPSDEEKDANLLDKLKKEIEGIISVSVEALHQAFKNNRLCDTEYSKEKRKDIRISSDTLEAFISDMCVVDTSQYVKQSEFNEIYKAYCKENEYTGLKPKTLKNAMETKNYESKKRDGYNIYKGINIKSYKDIKDYDLQQVYLRVVTLDAHIKRNLMQKDKELRQAISKQVLNC